MVLSMVPTLSSVFLMQRLFVICDLDSYSDMKKLFHQGNTFQKDQGGKLMIDYVHHFHINISFHTVTQFPHQNLCQYSLQTINIARSPDHLDKRVLAQSNVILCLSTIGGENIGAMTNASELYAIEYPWIIAHNGDELGLLEPSRIDQQLYFYNTDTGSLYERYSVNSVVVTRQLDISRPMAPLHERRADFQGIELTLVVGVWHPQFGIKDTTKLEVKTMPSGDKMHIVEEENAYGVQEDILAIMKNDLNFTVRPVHNVMHHYVIYAIKYLI